MGETKKLRLAADRNSGGLYDDLCERMVMMAVEHL